MLASSGGGAKLVDLDATFFVQLALFLSLLFILSKTLFKPLMEVSGSREDKTKLLREKAKKLSVRTDEILKRYEAEMAAARTAALKIRTELLEDGKRIKERMTAGARKEAEELYRKNLADLEKYEKTFIAGIDSSAEALKEEIIIRIEAKED